MYGPLVLFIVDELEEGLPQTGRSEHGWSWIFSVTALHLTRCRCPRVPQSHPQQKNPPGTMQSLSPASGEEWAVRDTSQRHVPGRASLCGMWMGAWNRLVLIPPARTPMGHLGNKGVLLVPDAVFTVPSTPALQSHGDTALASRRRDRGFSPFLPQVLLHSAPLLSVTSVILVD